jgi:hypothetical protein
VSQSRPTRGPAINAAGSVVVSVRAITLSTSPIFELRVAQDERQQAKCNRPSDKLTAGAKDLADQKVEKLLRMPRIVEADLGPT